ncbi:DUF5050 domain-containing protein [Brevibacillus laterosporus]|uniref:DUF5050 domain-containing protein n=1 Tax=Brevibacillus laterosporus TaxID=1465 RepID=UPI002E1DA141
MLLDTEETFFITGNETALKTDGMKSTKLTDDQINSVIVNSYWIYYSNVTDGNKLYKIKTDGTSKQNKNKKVQS